MNPPNKTQVTRERIKELIEAGALSGHFTTKQAAFLSHSSITTTYRALRGLDECGAITWMGDPQDGKGKGNAYWDTARWNNPLLKTKVIYEKQKAALLKQYGDKLFDAAPWLSALLTTEWIGKLERKLKVKLGPMLGCGNMGCAFQAGAGVVKITADETEGPIWQMIGDRQRAGDYGFDAFAFVWAIVKLHDVTVKRPRRRKESPIYVIHREDVEPFTNLPDVRGAFYGARVDPGRRILGISPPITGEGIDRLVRLLHDYKNQAYEYYERKTGRPRRLEGMQSVLYEVGNYAPSIGEIMLILQHEGMPLRDIHAGNIGVRLGPNKDGVGWKGQLVILDPGWTPTDRGDKDIKRLKNPAARVYYHGGELAGPYRPLYLTRAVALAALGGKYVYAFTIAPDARWVSSMDTSSLLYQPERLQKLIADRVQVLGSGDADEVVVLDPSVLTLLERAKRKDWRELYARLRQSNPSLRGKACQPLADAQAEAHRAGHRLDPVTGAPLPPERKGRGRKAEYLVPETREFAQRFRQTETLLQDIVHNYGMIPEAVKCWRSYLMGLNNELNAGPKVAARHQAAGNWPPAPFKPPPKRKRRKAAVRGRPPSAWST